MSINTEIDKTSDLTLDGLFALARDDQEEYQDNNFTKVVLNSLPRKSHRVGNKWHYPNIISLVVGLIVAYFVVEPTQLLNKAIALLPSNISISITLMNMMILFVVSSGLALTAWWSVESKSRI